MSDGRFEAGNVVSLEDVVGRDTSAAKAKANGTSSDTQTAEEKPEAVQAPSTTYPLKPKVPQSNSPASSAPQSNPPVSSAPEANASQAGIPQSSIAQSDAPQADAPQPTASEPVQADQNTDSAATEEEALLVLTPGQEVAVDAAAVPSKEEARPDEPTQALSPESGDGPLPECRETQDTVPPASTQTAFEPVVPDLASPPASPTESDSQDGVPAAGAPDATTIGSAPNPEPGDAGEMPQSPVPPIFSGPRRKIVTPPAQTTAQDSPPLAGAEDPDRAYRSIGDVVQEVGVPQHVLRFWETKFSALQPLKRGGGRRLYRPDDVTLIKAIHAMIEGHGRDIEDVERIMVTRGAQAVREVLADNKLSLFLQAYDAEIKQQEEEKAAAQSPTDHFMGEITPVDQEVDPVSFADLPLSMVNAERPFTDGPDLTESQRQRLAKVLDLLTDLKLEIAEFRHMRERSPGVRQDLAQLDTVLGEEAARDQGHAQAGDLESDRALENAKPAGEPKADKPSAGIQVVLPQVSRQVPD